MNPNATANLLPAGALLEEEQNPDYDPKRFYPARIGETINGKYQIISKLGFGTGSTVWLAEEMNRWPWQPSKYMALKITNCFEGDRKSANEELQMSRHISQIQSNHEDDLKADNLLLGFEDSSVIDGYAKAQRQNPGLYKESDGRRIYQSQPDFGHFSKGTGVLKISDFGAAVFGNTASLYYHDMQPEQFAASEVLLGAGWTYSADIWNLGMVLWELLEDISLLDGVGPENKYDRQVHFAQMIRLLGPPPAELLERANKGVYAELYSEQGEFKHSQLMPPEDFTFESQAPSLQGEEKGLFIQFAQRMLKWVPEERATAK
ncbi:hypothetical protein V500_01055 [Pseudogymnoascus sp. VKM F-4518 (FW-2643)]|nr:hypothetical protein V500_01055 [Pseudogymnoascus sp. VKM F-4518 (FW-2643)]